MKHQWNSRYVYQQLLTRNAAIFMPFVWRGRTGQRTQKVISSSRYRPYTPFCLATRQSATMLVRGNPPGGNVPSTLLLLNHRLRISDINVSGTNRTTLQHSARAHRAVTSARIANEPYRSTRPLPVRPSSISLRHKTVRSAYRPHGM